MYSYTSVPVKFNSGIAGTIERGSRRRMQTKGAAFSSNLSRRGLLNFVNGELSSVTVLGHDGSTIARLFPTAKF